MSTKELDPGPGTHHTQANTQFKTCHLTEKRQAPPPKMAGKMDETQTRAPNQVERETGTGRSQLCGDYQNGDTVHRLLPHLEHTSS